VESLFHMSEIRSLIERHLARKVNAGYQLWGLLTLFLWMKRWDIEIASPEDYALAEAFEFAAAS
jgi:hypothetical protein